jgi:hypothetical protein
VDIGGRDRLLGRVHRHPTTTGADRRPGLFDGQIGAIALLTQMQEDNVSRPAGPRTIQDGLDQPGALSVREMPTIAEVPRDQVTRTPRPALKLDIMVELDTEQVNVGECIGHRARPDPGIGQITDRDRLRPPSGSSLEAKPEGRAAVVREFDRLDLEAVWRQERAIVVGPEQTGSVHRGERFETFQFAAVPFVGIERNASDRQPAEGRRVDVVAVGVSQDNRMDVVPRRADAREPPLDRLGPDAEIDQSSRGASLDEGRIPARAAGKHGELNGHQFALIELKGEAYERGNLVESTRVAGFGQPILSSPARLSPTVGQRGLAQDVLGLCLSPLPLIAEPPLWLRSARSKNRRIGFGWSNLKGRPPPIGVTFHR